MAKKKSHKKQSFKYAEPTAPRAETSSRSTQSVVKSTTTSAVATPVSLVEYPYLTGDLRRLGVIAVALVAIEIGLWYLFGHTSLGSTVYNLYHLGS